MNIIFGRQGGLGAFTESLYKGGVLPLLTFFPHQSSLSLLTQPFFSLLFVSLIA